MHLKRASTKHLGFTLHRGLSYIKHFGSWVKPRTHLVHIYENFEIARDWRHIQVSGHEKVSARESSRLIISHTEPGKGAAAAKYVTSVPQPTAATSSRSAAPAIHNPAVRLPRPPGVSSHEAASRSASISPRLHSSLPRLFFPLRFVFSACVAFRGGGCQGQARHRGLSIKLGQRASHARTSLSVETNE